MANEQQQEGKKFVRGTLVQRETTRKTTILEDYHFGVHPILTHNWTGSTTNYTRRTLIDALLEVTSINHSLVQIAGVSANLPRESLVETGA